MSNEGNDPIDPIRTWHAQKERADFLLEVCKSVRSGELNRFVGEAALVIAGVPEEIATVATCNACSILNGEEDAPPADLDGGETVILGDGVATESIEDIMARVDEREGRARQVAKERAAED